MSRTEDYLDELLNSVSSEQDGSQDGGKAGTKTKSPEEDFLSAFEEELLSGEESEEFLQQFEQELDFGGKGFDSSAAASENMESLQSGSMELHPAEEDANVDAMIEDGTKQEAAEEEIFGGDIENGIMMDDLDSILNSAKERMDASEEGTETMDSDGVLMVDTFGENLEDNLENEPFSDGSDLEKRLGNIADATEGLTGIGDLGDDFGLDDLETDSLEGEEVSELSLDADPVEEEQVEGADGKKKKRARREKKKKKEKDTTAENGEKISFFQKFSRLVFGADEEEEAGNATAEGGTGDAADPDMALLNELGGGGGSAAAVQEPEKKSSKKEKKKKEKKPKPKKEKQPKPPKPKKPKKEKPPKEKDLTPPLPKVPVILICIMTGSLLALILMGTNLVGYSTQFAEAEKAYKTGDYTEAYRCVRGMEVKEKDTELMEKYRVMAGAQSKFDAYQSFMETGIYDMALDSLVHTIGRCDKYAADAELYGCYSELIALKDSAVGALSTFGINEEIAAQLYGIEDKQAYSIELHTILLGAGLVTED